MPITTFHPEYETNIHRWCRVRDCRVGSDAVKSEGDKYLPRLGKQSSDDYDSYKLRAMFLPVVSRTIGTLVGLATLKRPELTGDTRVLDLAPNIGVDNEPLQRIAARILEELVSVGRVGALVDVGSAIGSLPSIALYHAESIINWDTAVVDGKRKLVTAVLAEDRIKYDPEDVYAREVEVIHRELAFGVPPAVGSSPQERASFARREYGLTDKDMETGVYYQAIWSQTVDKVGKKGEWSVEQVIVPRRPGGAFLRTIPFEIINEYGVGSAVGEVPMDDLATLNLSHYLNSADLEHGRHFTALPTAWFAGFEYKGDITIGSPTAYVSEETNARAGFLEFTGAGLGHLAQGMEQKERLMAVIGVRFLETNSSGPEKPEAMRLRQQGDRATLVALMDVVEESVSDLLEYCMWFMAAADTDDSFTFSMPRDFTETRLDPQLLTAYIEAVQGGILSWKSFVGILASSGTLPDGVDAEEEASRLLAGIPGGGLDLGGQDPSGESQAEEPQDAAQ